MDLHLRAAHALACVTATVIPLPAARSNPSESRGEGLDKKTVALIDQDKELGERRRQPLGEK
jgi:hypothetical protein